MLTTNSVKKAAAGDGKTVIGKVNEEDAAVLDEERDALISDPEVAHSPLGPSSGKRWMNCLGSVLFTEDMENSSSEYADEGNAAHELSEWVRESGKPAKTFIGREITITNKKKDGSLLSSRTFTVDNEMATAVQQFVDFCEDLDGDPYYEERVHYTTWVKNGWGTADDIRIEERAGGTCHVTDLKYGKGVQVFVKDDPQLKLYALGVFQDLGILYDIKEFHLTIVQPRLGHIDEMTISLKDLLIWARDVVMPTAIRAFEPDAPFAVGSWCQFCPANRPGEACLERDRIMQEDYASDFDDPPVDELPGFKLGEILDKAKLIRDWLANVEARALSELQKGNPITGAEGDYKLVAGRSARVWRDAAAAEKALRSVSRLKVADIFTKKLISAPQAEKLLGKGHPLLNEHVDKPPGKPVMVPASDPRQTLQVNAEEEFEDLGDED